MGKKKDASFFSDEDWQDLLPNKEVKLASKSLFIEPFGLKSLKWVIQKIMSLRDTFTEKAITQDNFNSPENIPVVAEILIDNVPEILAEAAGIPVADLIRLPMSPVIEILNAVIDVNLESQRGLEKNLPSLVAKLMEINKATKNDQ